MSRKLMKYPSPLEQQPLVLEVENSEESIDLGKKQHQLESASKDEIDEDDLNEFDIPAEKSNGDINYGRSINNHGIQRLLRGPRDSGTIDRNLAFRSL